MATAQFGIFAVGTSAHCFLEFSLKPGVDPQTLATAIADIEEPHTTVGGANLVTGLRPSLWSGLAPDDMPANTEDFAAPMVGPGRFTMPATQRDAWVWVSGAARDLVFDMSAAIIDQLHPVAEVATEVTGWSYRHSRDLTGFEDGTENPPLAEAGDVAVVPDTLPGAGASVVLVQQWVHHTNFWNNLPVAEQERVMGRTKLDSVELDDAVKPVDSHVARNVITDDSGQELHIFRRNVPYGTVTDHGTMFVGFSFDPPRMTRMLERMAGIEDGVRDALTRYTTPLTGAYYVVPSVESLRAFATPSQDD
ncbi:Dyp-type peroxidase [Jatrophihabitans telluris]|uniref:Dyp-type peroxidase n=1 Tax=Jatrophihabitans telluris TaxID=2038343 RepID=A0ABY4R0W3_9ACTN|nr:Dyp-type peroxidase [Jatrophihabitans telluris]UQX88800.1 Dyp-type peroxidase [Jatrophihabitans telluris]